MLRVGRVWQVKVLLFEIVFFLHIFSIHGWLNPQMQNPWIWREDSVCVCVCVCVCVHTHIYYT